MPSQRDRLTGGRMEGVSVKRHAIEMPERSPEADTCTPEWIQISCLKTANPPDYENYRSTAALGFLKKLADAR